MIRYAVPLFRERGAAFSTSFAELWSIFKAATRDPGAGNVVCVFDALDECNAEEVSALIENLVHCAFRQQPCGLKFLITSRPYFEIRQGFDKLLEVSNNIELTGNEESASIEKEIDLVIKDRVAKLKQEIRLRETVSAHLEERLLGMKHRTYLWLYLIFKIIKKNLSGTRSEMDRLIDHLPDDIQGSYEVLLQRCADPMFTKKVLQIVLAAARPLTLREMDFALHINEESRSYADLEMEGDSRLHETLPSRCGLVITIIQSKVYFIHQTVKDFLLARTGGHSGRFWQQSLDLREANSLLARICLWSFSLKEVDIHRANLVNALLSEQSADRQPNIYCQTQGFLSYSAIYWADHFRDQESSQGIETVERILERSNGDVIYGSSGEHEHILQTASYGGHEIIARLLLGNGADVHFQGGIYGNALMAASIGGPSTIVQILLEKGANINARGGWYHGNALQAASGRGCERIVQILLENGADINAQGGYYGNALQAASIMGHERVVQILLKNGANINVQGGYYGNALQAASIRGHERVVQILLASGAYINARGVLYETPIQAASVMRRTKVVQILLENGADINIQGGFHENALQARLAGRHQEVVQIPLANGANIDAQGGFYGNAPQAASAQGHS